MSDQAKWTLPAAIIMCMSRVSVKGSGPGGNRSAWDVGAKREQGIIEVLGARKRAPTVDFPSPERFPLDWCGVEPPFFFGGFWSGRI